MEVEDEEDREVIVSLVPSKEKVEEIESSEKEEKIEKGGWGLYRGFGLTLVSCIMFSLGALIVKYLKEYNKASMGAWRFSGVFLPSLALLLYDGLWKKKNNFENIFPPKEPQHWKNIGFIIMRAFVGSTSLLFQFFAIKYLDLADALLICASSPIFVTFAARIFLGEECGVFPIVAALISLIGVAFITRPPLFEGDKEFDREKVIGTLLALGNMVFTTLTVISLRFLKDVHYAVTTCSFGIWGICECSIAALIIYREFSVPSTLYHFILVASMAGMTFFGQVAITKALQCEQAGPVALFRSFDVILAFLWQFIFLDTIPDIYSVVGSTIVLLCLFLTGVRKWILGLPPQNKMRKKLSLILK